MLPPTPRHRIPSPLQRGVSIDRLDPSFPHCIYTLAAQEERETTRGVEQGGRQHSAVVRRSERREGCLRRRTPSFICMRVQCTVSQIVRWTERPVWPICSLAARYVFCHCLNCNFSMGSTKTNGNITNRTGKRSISLCVFIYFCVFCQDRHENLYFSAIYASMTRVFPFPVVNMSHPVF
jgi:hypothetical protein